LDRVLQHQKLLQRQRRSGELSGRTQHRQLAPAQSGPSADVDQSATSAGRSAAPPREESSVDQSSVGRDWPTDEDGTSQTDVCPRNSPRDDHGTAVVH